MRENQNASKKSWFDNIGTMGLPDVQGHIRDAFGVRLPDEKVVEVFGYLPPDVRKRSSTNREKLEFVGDRVGRLAAVVTLMGILTPEQRAVLNEMSKPATDNEVYAAHLVRHGLHTAIYPQDAARKIPTTASDRDKNKLAGDTYEALLAAIYVSDRQAALDLASADTLELLKYGTTPIEAKKAYIKKYLYANARDNAGPKRREFDGSHLTGPFLEMPDVVAPALEVSTLTRRELNLLGTSVLELVLCEMLLRSPLATVGDYEEVMKTHMGEPIMVAHAKKFGLDKSLWGDENEIHTNDKTLRDSYAASIGAFYVYDPAKAFAVASKNLSDVLALDPSYKEAANKYTKQITGKTARTIDYEHTLNDLVRQITQKSHAVPVLQAPTYVVLQNPTETALSIVAVVIPAGVIDRMNPNANQHSNSLAYFAATGEGQNKAISTKKAAQNLIEWMLRRNLLVRNNDRITLNTRVYGDEVRKLFESSMYQNRYRLIPVIARDKKVYLVHAYGDFRFWPTIS
jgi:dsRNA-specific ribonuclease